MKTDRTNSATGLFKIKNTYLGASTEEKIDFLLKMRKFTFINFVSSNPDVLEFVLNNKELFSRLDDSILRGLARANSTACEALLNSHKFDDKDIYQGLVAILDHFDWYKGLPDELLKNGDSHPVIKR